MLAEMLPSEKLELAIYKFVDALGPFAVSASVVQLSQVTGEKDYGRIIERLKDLDANNRLLLTKYKGGSRLSRPEFGNDGGFFYTDSFLIEIAPQGRKYFEELELRTEQEKKPMKEPVTHGEDNAKDDLLPVLRRKVFDRDLEALGSSASEGEPLSLLMLDVDHFKVVNDTHGHPVGDEVLIECANIVAGRCRYKGKVYRVGGEEIAVLLPNFTVAEAVALAESIRSQIERKRMSSKRLAITASIGVATTPTHTTEGKQLLKIADEALYAAKHLGRNLVRIAGEDPATPTSDVLRRAEPVEAGQPVEMTLSYQRLLYTGEHHNYRLTLTLKNISTALIDNYHVDVLFPTGLLHKDLIYALELPNRRTATHRLFRISTETRQVNTLYPGDPVVTMTVDYYVDREIFHYHHEWLQENVTAILYIKGRPPLTVQRPISEMQEF
jgi:diguanylate cyclase (GGDEF)-like protein